MRLRPTIVCADHPSQGQVAYDGSLPSMRATQMFALLGITGTGRRAYVVSVDASEELATRRACGASIYLQSHGLAAKPIPLTSRVEPSELIKAEVAERGIGTIVMGAYGHRGWRQILFGTTTRRLAENPPCALFIYH